MTNIRATTSSKSATADKTEPRSLLEQAGEASDLAKTAFADGNSVVGIAALVLAAQLIQLVRIRENMKP